MGKLSISVPADLERELRARAKEENTTISAILTEAARGHFDSARNLAAAQQLLAESIAEHGPVPEQDKADVAAFLTEVEEYDRRQEESELRRAS